MAQFRFEISMSLDGFVAGPDPTLDDPLGKGGEQLHEWALATASWRESHGRGSEGERNVDDELMQESLRTSGATIMGRRMFSGGEGPWEQDPNPEAWWGDEPPFHHPVFVLTHHEREPMTKGETTFTFVTDGIESALEQAREAAGDKDVALGGGADVAQQYLNAGLLEQVHIHVVPLFLGGGVRLFDNVADAPGSLELVELVASPTGVAHMKYRVAR